MLWITLKTTDNVEHTLNVEAIDQVVGQSNGEKQVRLRNGDTLHIGAQVWASKLHEEIQRSRDVSWAS